MTVEEIRQLENDMQCALFQMECADVHNDSLEYTKWLLKYLQLAEQYREVFAD